MDEFEKEESKKKIREKLDNIEGQSSFDKSMGDATHEIKFASGVVDDLAEMFSKTPEEEDQEERDYQMRVYDRITEQIAKGEVIFYSDGYSLEDYVNKDGEISPEAYWRANGGNSGLFYNYTYEKFLKELWPEYLKEGVTGWTDVQMIYKLDEPDDKGYEYHTICIITPMTKSYIISEYEWNIKYNEEKLAGKKTDDEILKCFPDADDEIDMDYHREELERLKMEGVYKSTLGEFNDIACIPKKYNSLSNEDITRCIRWFIKKKLKIDTPYRIRYATEEEREGGRSMLKEVIEERMKEYKDSENIKKNYLPYDEYLETFNIEDYRGKYYWL